MAEFLLFTASWVLANFVRPDCIPSDACSSCGFFALLLAWWSICWPGVQFGSAHVFFIQLLFLLHSVPPAGFVIQCPWGDVIFATDIMVPTACGILVLILLPFLAPYRPFLAAGKRLSTLFMGFCYFWGATLDHLISGGPTVRCVMVLQKMFF